MIKLRINGRDVELEGPTRLGDYLAFLGVDQRAVAVELNERILERSEFAGTTLAAGDVVEIVRMVGGGLHEASGILARRSHAAKGEGRTGPGRSEPAPAG